MAAEQVHARVQKAAVLALLLFDIAFAVLLFCAIFARRPWVAGAALSLLFGLAWLNSRFRP